MTSKPSQTSKHSRACPPSKYKYDRYSAADKLLGEYLSEALKSSMALLLSDFRA